jgi:hypothetical protein
LIRAGRDADTATRLAEHAVLGIQGALVLARATRDERLFGRALHRLALELDWGAETSAHSGPRTEQR